MSSRRNQKEFPATVLDLRDVCAGKRIFLTADPHGCFDELIEGLAAAGYIEGEDILILAGDLGDRGPKIRQVFEFAMNTKNVFTLLGNHCFKLLRYLWGRPVQTRSLEATIKQLGLNHTMPEVVESNRETYLEFLEGLPHLIRFGDMDWAVHAGVHPHQDIADNSAQFCMYGGRFDPATNQFGRDTGHVWYQFYEREERIFFGHLVHKSAFPLHATSDQVIALDGGCVFGGVQRVALLEPGEPMQIFETPAKKVYFGRLTEGAN